MSVVLALTAWAVMASDPPRCAAITLAPSVVCSDAPKGVIVSDDPATASQFLQVMLEGEARFRRHFGVDPTPYGLIVGEGVNPMSGGVSGMQSGDLQNALQAAGATTVLPWLSDEQMADSIRDVRRRTIEAEARAEGLDGPALDREVQRRLDAMPVTDPAERRAAAAHEFGHLWLVRHYWPDRKGPTGHYGGPAPDWFDESAAVLMEDEAMAASRRRGFAETWRRSGTARPKALASYFVDPHPMAGRQMSPQTVPSTLTPQQVAAGGARPISELPPDARIRTVDGREITVADLPPGSVMMSVPPGGSPPSQGGRPLSLTVTSAREALPPDQQDAAVIFYAQARLLADFLFERSGDEQLYARIARAYVAGRDMDQWLADEGVSLNLPSSVAELDAAWNGWLVQTYGPPG